MLHKKIEEAIVHKFIAKIILSSQENPVYGVFTGCIKVLNNIDNDNVNATYRYYLKEINLDEYSQKKDIYKATKSVLTLMHDQITDIEESVTTGFSRKLNQF